MSYPGHPLIYPIVFEIATSVISRLTDSFLAMTITKHTHYNENPSGILVQRQR
jgi:hypothetical protein